MIPTELIDKMIRDKKIRVAITKESHWYFFHLYFAHYMKYASAFFHKEIFDLTEDETVQNLFIVAFRGSGKSTLLTTSYPIWAILGKQQKKFVLILAQTQSQAKQHMMNLRRELENNELLKNDLGPFREESDEWGSVSLVFSNFNARITVASSEQGIRGIRHNEHRPDLIIGDDVEDLTSTKTKEGRDKTYQWLTGEVIPAGEINTRLIIVGNLLHEDSLLMRIKENIEKNTMNGTFKEYPLIRNGEILWQGKYPNMEAVEAEKRKAGNEFAWQREYLLKIVPSEDQTIRREWIHYHDAIPDIKIKNKRGHSLYYGMRIGIDLAISQKESADYTAMVPAYVFENDKFGYQIYIAPKIINKRLNFPETIEMCKTMYKSYYFANNIPQFVIENVGYQDALIQQLHGEDIWNIHPFNPGNDDKRTRLAMTANMIKSGQILFPKEGCEELINQIVNFGVEKHDDLADAFSSLILSIINRLP